MKLINADELVKVLREKQKDLLGYKCELVSKIIDIIKSMPNVSDDEKAKRLLP